jgi:hypothetical protein
MLESIALIVLIGKVSDMARRRGRSTSLFGLMLLIGWLVGEGAGGTLGYLAHSGGTNLLLIYGLALAGATVGAGIAFLVAASFRPVDGAWRDLGKLPVRRSRLRGALIGGVAGGVFGALVVAFMYGGQQSEGNLPLVLQGFLAVGFVGALLGLVSGVQKD